MKITIPFTKQIQSVLSVSLFSQTTCRVDLRVNTGDGLIKAAGDVTLHVDIPVRRVVQLRLAYPYLSKVKSQ